MTRMIAEVNCIYQVVILYIYYACSRNTERNLFTICLFNNYISATHPMDISGVDLMKVPNNVVIVVSAIYDKNN